ncbi:KGK domain-containing protein [Chroococcus sp. FPU101]|uniref:KGK domain-containing protein n=1 Tax=Chroococcus sp. FPU101 TaxID=1974212 RepID=UPI001A8C5A7A|nr:KGK domain-containing protein [Chroococcus sp. FPU101]
MSVKIMLLKSDEVISLNDFKDRAILSHKTFKAEEFIYGLLEKMDHDAEKRIKWRDGVECEILSPNAGWKKGKIRVTLEFIPDEPESILDDIRQTIS